jgi:transcriptional regulator with XRE-family HTH domain
MPKKPRKVVGALTIVKQIDWLLENARYYESRERGKRFYDPHEFSSLLTAYVAQSGKTMSEQAVRLGMGRGTLKRLMNGGTPSDTMLLRIRSALSAEAQLKAKKLDFAGEWHDATPRKVAAAISTVSEKLLFLKKVIESSNFLLSEDSPIDKIQVLQLIALLTATIEALRAPFVDKKQASGFFRWLGGLAKTSAQKGIEKIVVDAMNDATHAGADLIHQLSSQVGMPDLSDFFP